MNLTETKLLPYTKNKTKTVAEYPFQGYSALLSYKNTMIPICLYCNTEILIYLSNNTCGDYKC